VDSFGFRVVTPVYFEIIILVVNDGWSKPCAWVTLLIPLLLDPYPLSRAQNRHPSSLRVLNASSNERALAKQGRRQTKDRSLMTLQLPCVWLIDANTEPGGSWPQVEGGSAVDILGAHVPVRAKMLRWTLTELAKYLR